MPTLIEVWDSRLGVTEIAGPKHNPIIVGWCKDAGHPEIIDDETAWCSTSMCSAAKASDLPFPPVNVNPAARSWLTMGVGKTPEEAEPGDVVVWPRNNSTWQGHVNMIRYLRYNGGKIEARCIGGNQGARGAVTLTDWVDLAGALPNGIRRLVPATVPALREAGSTTVKSADNEQKLGIFGAFFVPIFEGVKALIEPMFGPVAPPKFASLPEGLTFWSSLLEQSNRVATYAFNHPVLAAVLLVSIGMVVRAQLTKRARLAEHQAGIPIAAEVAKLGAA